MDILGNVLKLRPLLWKSSFYSYLNIGWQTWHGADHLYDNQIHKNQKNGFGTRGAVPNKSLNKNIILLGDSFIETSHPINNMPERYLKDYVGNSNVISFGSWGWGTDQQLLHLKKHIKKIKPEKIVLIYQLNDENDNNSRHGFMGGKPTFDLKKKKDQLILTGPNHKIGKNYLEYSYFYRVMIKLINKINLNNKETFLEIADTCDKTKKYDDTQKELKNYFNRKKYSKNKEIETYEEKPYGRKPLDNFPNFENWQSNLINGFLDYESKKSKANNFHSFYDPFTYNSEIMTPEKKVKELLTNKLLNEIQSVSLENNSNFYLVFVNMKSFFQSFESDKKYFFCHNNKELIYSNEAFTAKLNRLFKDITNVLIIDFEKDFTDKYYDLFDGHFNDSANKYLMEKVASLIK